MRFTTLESFEESRLVKMLKLDRWIVALKADLSRTYSRDLQKWLIIAPIIGVTVGVLITAVSAIILDGIWAALLPRYIRRHALIIPGLLAGFILTGVLMSYGTSDPDEHSTEEIIRSYHERQGEIDMRPFWSKLAAAIATVGFGGSAALEGPSIYGGGAIGSWLWKKLAGFGLAASDRRIMLISGAAAGMAAVFRAPLTGLVFALEMPYKDDLAHEALLPSLIASVTSYATLAAVMGPQPLFRFGGAVGFSDKDLLWSALLGLICGLGAMNFANGFRRVRVFFVEMRAPLVFKLAIGGFGTALCGLLYLHLYPGPLVPIGPNYEAVPIILEHTHTSAELVTFAFLKLVATLFSLGSGGVSAMFVPLFISGGAIGRAFAQSIVGARRQDLFAAVGMSCFISAAYKTPLAAVVFVAETGGSHSYIIPTLIGAAVAYAVSGEASVSGDQRLHEVRRGIGPQGTPPHGAES